MITVASIRQTEAAECGLACLAIASARLGAVRDLAELRRLFPISPRGATLQDLMTISSALRMTSRPLKCELEELPQLKAPAILHWGLNHFVVLLKADRTSLLIQDPARGVRKVRMREAAQQFTGVALELAAAPDFRRRKERSRLKLTSLFKLTPAMTASLAQTLVLSLLLQAYVVISPFYMQLAIDEAALKGDGGLLGLLAVGFGLFSLFNVGASALRGVALQKVSALLGWDMTGRLFHHMLRLPLPWFQRRRLADALSRFESIQPIRALFSNGLIGSIIDGALAVTTLAMMLIFDWKLALIAAAGLLIYVLIRLVAIPATLQLAGDALVADVAEQGRRIETLRAIQTIKVMGAESQREGVWANSFAQTIRTSQASAFANIGFGSLQAAFDALAGIGIVYLGASAVIRGDMTVGVLFAFMAYSAQFSARAQALFETFVSWRMMDLHSDRLADIALASPEPGIDDLGGGLPPLKGAVEVSNLAFRYAPQEPVVFQGVNFRIEPGEFVAVIGPSGSGKSTLIKVLCGLYPAAAGEVRLDGLPLRAWGPRTIRRNLGAVLQDDELLSGSIAENVAFFAEDIDMDWVWACLKLAAIDEEVRAMPMREHTFVGDLGTALSGGQKQRVLLARALYRRPKLLVLDEATSHLDLGRERQISTALSMQSVTRIIVAHRPETIAAADRIFVLQDGGLKEVRAVKPATAS